VCARNASAARGGQQRVDDRMSHGVAVGVPREGLLPRPFQTREPQRAVAAEAVHVGADPDARRTRRGSGRGGGVRSDGGSGVREQGPRAVEVGTGGDLEGCRVPRDRDHGVTRGGHQRRVVGVIGVGGAERLFQDGTTEALRRLRGGEFGSVHGGDDRPLGIHALDRVDDGDRRDHGVRTRVERGDDPLEHRRRGQRPRRVVHEHGVDVRPQGGEPRRDG